MTIYDQSTRLVSEAALATTLTAYATTTALDAVAADAADARDAAETATAARDTAVAAAAEALAVGNTNDTIIAGRINAPSSATRQALDSAFVPAVMPEKFGAVGNGVADDTAAVQAAVDSLPASGGRVLLAQRYKISTVTITKADVCITGPGTIVDGSIAIGVDGSGPPYARMDTRIERVAFKRSTVSSSVNAITAARSYGITVEGVDFEGYNSAFYVRPQSFTGTNTAHVARVLLDAIRVNNCNFVVRIPPFASGGGWSGTSDLTLTGCRELAVLDSHVFAEGIDGLHVTDNFMFMPGSNEQSPTKRWHVRVIGGTQVDVIGNKLFEAGLESVYLSKVQMVGVDLNSIHTPGQREYSDAIRLDQGDPAGDEFVLGSITGNKIIFPTRHGISIEDNSSHVSIDENIIRHPGDLTRFYGSGPAPAADYINTETTTKNIVVGTANNLSTGAGSPAVRVRGSQSRGRAGVPGMVFLPGSQTPLGHFGWGTSQINATYPFGQRRVSDSGLNNSVTYSVELEPGVYSLDLWHHAFTDRGIYEVRVNGVNVGTIDGYDAAETWKQATLTGISVPVGGLISVALVMSSKNAASSAHRGAFAALSMTRTGNLA